MDTERSTRSRSRKASSTRFAVVKKFVSGPLTGLEVADDSPVPFEVGKVYGGFGLGSRYVVISSEAISR